ncbi:MAG: DUF695 domain-containing protein [Fimbriimonadales bacterium]
MPRLISVADVRSDKRERLPYAITVRLPYRAQENGLPAKGELGRVMDLEEKVMDALEPMGVLHLGHTTSNGEMKVFLYSREQVTELLTVKAGLLKKETLKLESRLDPDWSIYEMEMAPSEMEYERAKFHQLFEVLDGHGDVASKPREVDFKAIFSTETQRSAFMNDVAAEGFLPSPEPVWEGDDGKFWCELIKTTSVEPDVICAETAYLRRKAELHGGEFDGWAYPVYT